MRSGFKFNLLFLAAFLSALLVKAQHKSSDFSDLVPFVTTPIEVVKAMLEIAEINPNDILYDLGSGDGRISIYAAQQYGIRSIGVEIDADLVNLANQNAKEAGVKDLVSFIEGDLFELDLSQATVLTLYLFPDINLKLRPRILEMKAGTRIISHRFDMGDWEPDKVQKIKLPDGKEHIIYLWVLKD
ncbi:SAM-dependent methyltransferases related to tRNA (uracil-5-)-methyltransferase [Aquiflexum balticum DSM 16537]|uniref:SAM-dependent methyltransferases related to tRNA (Uracil-5-)-methyltransferase n=1 Tax=Aquiflexum balticum DSM 16537 TaxID=758820 RepID=A0A1W2H4L8_9BACT|nr:SAM-dependent methyltransferases related to tRNA (uracil-5-)-methyltransferase [Aquiflexum balticum DSM 16537]